MSHSLTIDFDRIYRIKTGDWAGFEATIASISDDSVVLNVSVLGRQVPVSFPKQTFASHVELFGNVAPIKQNDLGTLDRELHALHSDADTLFQTELSTNLVFASIQLSKSVDSCRVAISKLGMTWPAGTERKITLNTQVPKQIWSDFTHLIDRIGFWEMDFDDGIRLPLSEERNKFNLRGWRNGKTHEVRRQSLGNSAIRDACHFLSKLDPAEEYDI